MKPNTLSNITKKDLLRNPANYLWLQIPEQYSNINFSLLLDFIEYYSDFGKDNRYGNAYYIIRKEANKFFGVGRYSPRKLKISKYEIKSLRNSYTSKLNGKQYLKIPYKISYIFKAIISIIENIKIQNNVELSPDLQHTLNLTYRIAFYEKYVATYDAFYQEILKLNFNSSGYRLKAELHNDFHSEGSVLNTVVK